MSKPWSVTEAFQNTWGQLLRDFHQWVIPDTDDLLNWCNRPARQAIGVCPSSSMDDPDAMLGWWRSNANGTEGGNTAYLPVLLTAFESAVSVPMLSNLMGVPYAFEVRLPNDPENRVLKLRAVPVGIRAQVVFFAPNAHSATFAAAQFCAFMSDENKRRQILTINMGAGMVSDWTMTIFDNELSPSSTATQDNLKGWTVDVTLSGLVPQLIRQRDPTTGHLMDQLEDVPVMTDSNINLPSGEFNLHTDPISGETTETQVQP